MSSDPGTPTLDQLRVLMAVVENGSFAGAARRLNRATSVISYAISNLENQLGVTLFDRQSTRKPVLTNAGKTVLAEAKAAAGVIDGLRAKVKGLRQGLEAEVHVAVDVMMPNDRLLDALQGFSEAFPTVQLHLHVEALGAVTQLVLDRVASIGISGPLDEIETGNIQRVGVGNVELVPVAAPGHPLAEGPNLPGAARKHVQLVLTDRSQLTEGKDFAVMGTYTWRLADLGAKHLLLKGGIGWGNMPLPMVEEDLAAGRLVQLDMPDNVRRTYTFDAIYPTDAPPGPAGQWLIDRFKAQAGEGGEAQETPGNIVRVDWGTQKL